MAALLTSGGTSSKSTVFGNGARGERNDERPGWDLEFQRTTR
jgi:hypothetical protein